MDDQSGVAQKSEMDSKDEEIAIIEEKKEVQSDLEKANEFKKKGDYENAITYYSMFLSFCKLFHRIHIYYYACDNFVIRTITIK